jgi:hypothetical protein
VRDGNGGTEKGKSTTGSSSSRLTDMQKERGLWDAIQNGIRFFFFAKINKLKKKHAIVSSLPFPFPFPSDDSLLWKKKFFFHRVPFFFLWTASVSMRAVRPFFENSMMILLLWVRFPFVL